MITIISRYHKTLHCRVLDKPVRIDSHKVMSVEDEVGKILIESPWIEEVKENVVPIFRGCGGCGVERPAERKIEEPIMKPSEEPVEKDRSLLKKKSQEKKGRIKINKD